MASLPFTRTSPRETLPVNWNRVVGNYLPGKCSLIINHSGFPGGSVRFGVCGSKLSSANNWSRLLNTHRDVSNTLTRLERPRGSLPTVSMDGLEEFEPWDCLAAMELVLGARDGRDYAVSKVRAIRPETLAHLTFWARALGLVHTTRLSDHVYRWMEAALAGKGFVPSDLDPYDYYGAGPGQPWESRKASHYVCYLYVAIVFGWNSMFKKVCEAILKHTIPVGSGDDSMVLPDMPTGVYEIVEPVLCSINQFRLDAMSVMLNGVRCAVEDLWQSNDASNVLQVALIENSINPSAQPENVTISVAAIAAGLQRVHRTMIANIMSRDMYLKGTINLGALSERVMAGLQTPEKIRFTDSERVANRARTADEQVKFRMAWQMKADRRKYGAIARAEEKRTRSITTPATRPWGGVPAPRVPVRPSMPSAWDSILTNAATSTQVPTRPAQTLGGVQMAPSAGHMAPAAAAIRNPIATARATTLGGVRLTPDQEYIIHPHQETLEALAALNIFPTAICHAPGEASVRFSTDCRIQPTMIQPTNMDDTTAFLFRERWHNGQPYGVKYPW